VKVRNATRPSEVIGQQVTDVETHAERKRTGGEPELGEQAGDTTEPSRPTDVSAEEVRRLGVEARLIGLCLEGFRTLTPSVLRVQVVCGRCRKPTDMCTTSTAAAGTGPSDTDSVCPVCDERLGLRVATSVCRGGCNAVAHILGVNCHPVQLLRSDFEASCSECFDVARIRNVGAGYRKASKCMGCSTKLNLCVEDVDLLGQSVAKWRQVAEEQGEQMNARRQLQDARKIEKHLGLKVGQPLPGKGACKHYGQSYRWLRFPCCGRAFPCDVCHDEQTDHHCEWASRMLCGLCSHEQPLSKDQCSHCGAAQSRGSRSGHWEGGDGCRNRITMAKNDPHKYKGLGTPTPKSKESKVADAHKKRCS